MRFEPFVMERWQSVWEHKVRYNLSESGVLPLRVDELLEGDVGALAGERFAYPQSNGSEALRELVSDLYPGSDAANVIVTNGTAEANFLVVARLVEPGDEVVAILPNYMQVPGLARSLGAEVRPVFLREELGWHPDLDELRRAVTNRTKLVALCNPNNPTGAVLGEDELRAIAQIAGSAGAWILSDEVYQGAEREGEPSPTFYGFYDRLLVTCGLSKAYGLPGLRIGWIVGPAETIEEIWGIKDYTTIAPSALSERLARVALEPRRRHAILERTRTIVRTQFPILDEWVRRHGALFDMVPPKAGAIAYLRYDLPVDSAELAQRALEDKSVLVVPGSQFEMDRYLRIGYGYDAEALRRGLAELSEVLAAHGARVS